MGLLDNLDKQLENSKNILQSLSNFKHTKLKNINKDEKVYTTFNGKKIKVNTKRKIPKTLKIEKDKKEKKVRLTKSKRIYKRCPKNYNVYIESHWWEERKNKYYKTHKKICVSCGSAEYIALHHMLYADYGSEKDEHLTPLCSHCHHEFHALYGVKQNLILETNKFIEFKNEMK